MSKRTNLLLLRLTKKVTKIPSPRPKKLPSSKTRNLQTLWRRKRTKTRRNQAPPRRKMKTSPLVSATMRRSKNERKGQKEKIVSENKRVRKCIKEIAESGASGGQTFSYSCSGVTFYVLGLSWSTFFHKAETPQSAALYSTLKHSVTPARFRPTAATQTET